MGAERVEGAPMAAFAEQVKISVDAQS
jgi:hypothetical protein